MFKILVPVDGSENANRAVAHAIRFASNSKDPVELHLLNVQPPIVSGDVKMFVGRDVIDAYYRAEGERALAPARDLLARAGIAHTHHIGVGQIAETIMAYAREKECAQIVMGSRGLGALSGFLIGSVATKVLHLADVPVTLVR